MSIQRAGLRTNVIQVNVSIDVTQWDTGYVLVGRRLGGAIARERGRWGGVWSGGVAAREPHPMPRD